MQESMKTAAETPRVFDLKTAMVQMDVMPGNPDENVRKMLGHVKEAQANGDDVIVFPEMCVPGYLIGDDWLDGTLVQDFESYNQAILEATRGSDLVVIWGNVKTDTSKVNEDGTLRKYNAVYIAKDGEILGERYKTALPNYGEFDDKRYFHSTAQLAQEEGRSLESYMSPVEATVRGTKVHIGAAICEDGWGSGEGNDYAYDVMQMISDRGANALFNLSCSPVKNGKNFRRNQVFGDIAARSNVPLGYINNVGIQNNGKNLIPFDGATTIYNADGSLQIMKDDFEEGVVRGVMEIPIRSAESQSSIDEAVRLEDELSAEIIALKDRKRSEIKRLTDSAKILPFPIASPQVERGPESKEEGLENLYQMVLCGIKNFFESTGLERVVIGLSGGADSALVAKMLVDVLGAENVYGVNMPSKHNSDTTKDFASKLAQELGINYAVAPIQESVDYTVDQLESVSFELMDGSGKMSSFELSGLDKENIQARDRGPRILLGLASILGAVTTNNGNKSEVATGYSTVDGDAVGALAPIGDLYKSEVYDLMRYQAKKSGEAIPTLIDIADSIPSAELSDDQNIEEGKGDPFDYYYHDKLMFQLLEMRKNPEDILSWYNEGVLEEKLGLERGLPERFCGTTEAFITDLERINRLIKQSVFKRVQAQPIIRVSRKGFGYDLRESMLQGPVYYTQGYQEIKSQLLSA